MDRLGELKSKYLRDEALIVDDPSTIKGGGELDEFFKQVQAVQQGIKGIEQLTDEIKAKHSEALLNTDDAKAKVISAELDRAMARVTGLSKDVQVGLKKMDEKTKELSKTDKPADVRIRQNQHSQLTKQFVTAVRAYQETSQQFTDKYRDQIKRRVKARFSTANGTTLNDQQVEEYTQKIVQEGREDAIFQQAQDALEQIRENHRDILRIEESMRDLFNIMTDMAVLVEEQGELMDDILVNVGKSVEYVQRGREDLAKAKIYASRSRKKICCIIFVLLIIGAAILLPLYFKGVFKA